jgi:TPR repeat protein
MSGDDALSPRAQAEALALDVPQNKPETPAVAAVPAPNAVASTVLTQPTSISSAAEIRELLQHGDSLLRIGDVASARLFYERAAAAGDGRAALRLGATFDPAFLERLGLGKLQADAAEARSWYSRALDLGVIEAKRQLNGLETTQGK